MHICSTSVANVDQVILRRQGGGDNEGKDQFGEPAAGKMGWAKLRAEEAAVKMGSSCLAGQSFPAPPQCPLPHADSLLFLVRSPGLQRQGLNLSQQ